MATTASASTTAFGRIRTWCSTTTFGSKRWQRVLAAVITAVMFWPQASVDAAVGPDQSTLAGVALARIHHLEWGPEIVLTYGPLAFLQNTPYYTFDQSLLATIYQPIIVAALFLGIAAALRQRHAPMASLLGAFLTTGVVAILHIGHGGVSGLEYNELADLAALAWAAVPLLQQDPKRSTVFTTCTVLGAVAGLQLLVKLNAGLAIVAIALALSLLLDWRAIGRHCATVIAFAASTFIWWLLDGQRPGNLPSWLRSSAALASGYSAAENDPTLLNVVAVLLILAWIGALWMMFIRGGPQIPRRLVVLIGLATLIPAKSAMAKPDVWHLYAVLSLAVVAVAITPLFGSRGRALVVVVLATTLVLLGAEYAVVVLAGGYPSDTSRIAEALRAPAQAVDRLITLARPGRVDQRVAEVKARQRALYAIPDRFIKTIGSSTVHVDPYETSAAWAYDLTWRPAPVYQTSAAYMPALDDLNSESLANGPEFILSRQSPASPATGVGGMGGRLGVEESPRYSRAVLCNYTLTGVENRWALFTRTGPHCGPLTALSEVTVHGNDVIAVPNPSGPNMAVLVGIDLQPIAVDRLLHGTVAPPTSWMVVLDGVTYRLIVANAAEPFLLNTPVLVDGTNLQIDARTIGVVGHTSSIGQQGAVRLRFYEMRVGQ